MQQHHDLRSLTKRLLSLASEMLRIESFSWKIDANGTHAEVIDTVFPTANLILPFVPDDVENIILPVTLVTHLRASSCNKKDKNFRSVQFSTLFNVEVSKFYGQRYDNTGSFMGFDRMCPDVIGPDQEGGTTIAAWGDTAVLILSCLASSYYQYPQVFYADWGDGTSDVGLTCSHGQGCDTASVCRGNPEAVPSFTLSHKYDLNGHPSRSYGVTFYLCNDAGGPVDRCCDSIYRVVQIEDYESCSTAAGADQDSFDMMTFMDVANENANPCVSTDSTNMTFSNSCFDLAEPVMLGECNTGISECGDFTPISDVLGKCAVYLDYGEDGANEYSKCVERFTDPFTKGSPINCGYNCQRQSAPFLTQLQRDSLLCCADAYAHDNAKGMKKCSSYANDNDESPPEPKSEKKKNKGKDNRVRTRALRKMRGRMSKI